jgi:hypothetical protein
MTVDSSKAASQNDASLKKSFTYFNYVCSQQRHDKR